MRLTPASCTLLFTAAALSLAACGGGSSATVGGSLSGLASGASVVLQDNNSDNLTLTANGPFMFATDVSADSSFDVTVFAQPVGQTCGVTNGSGTVDTQDDPVSSVAVSCVTTSSVGGTVVGLTAGTSVTLSNGGATLPIAVNGAFAFPGVLVTGTTYDVLVATQPVGLTCTVTDPTGVVVANAMANVSVVCM